jgi:hypothetical protein
LYRDPSIPFEAYNSGATPRAKGQPDLFDGGANA